MRISLCTMVPAPIERVFDLSLDIDAHLASLAHSRERAVDGVTSGLIALGESVTWKARHFGVTWTMTTTITAWERPTSFTDEQAKGPFQSFRHVHRFQTIDAGTRMLDDIDYRAPLGALGATVDKMILNRYLRELIEVRNEFIVTRAAEQQ